MKIRPWEIVVTSHGMICFTRNEVVIIKTKEKTFAFQIICKINSCSRISQKVI